MKSPRPKPPKPRHQHIVIQKRESYASFATGVTEGTRISWKPYRSVQYQRHTPTAEEIFEGKKRGEGE